MGTEIETVKELWDEPLPYASGYTLDLYCDHSNPDHRWNSFPHTFHGETFWQCAQEARAKGWVIHRDRTATCPICNGK